MTFAVGIFTKEDVFAAIKNAKTESIEEGAIGAGTGTIAFGWKGGIGTSSRKLPASLGGYTIGVLVQTNFGGVLSIDGAPVGVELGKYYLKDAVSKNVENKNDLNDSADGSIIIVIATDAPVDARQLKRIAARSMSGLARTGSAMTNGSGDYAIAFSTAPDVRIKVGRKSALGQNFYQTMRCRRFFSRLSKRPKKRFTIRCFAQRLLKENKTARSRLCRLTKR